MKVIEEEYTIYGTDTDARIAISEKLKRVNKLDIPPDQVMMGQGVTPTMWLAIQIPGCSFGYAYQCVVLIM